MTTSDYDDPGAPSPAAIEHPTPTESPPIPARRRATTARRAALALSLVVAFGFGVGVGRIDLGPADAVGGLPGASAG